MAILTLIATACTPKKSETDTQVQEYEGEIGGVLSLVQTVEFNNETIPITVFYTRYTNEEYEYFCIDELVFNYDGKEHLITLKDFEMMPFEDPDVFNLIDVTTDYNFDNYMDISILEARGAYHSWSHIFIYNSQVKTFEYHEELSKQPDVWADNETQTVKVHGKGGHAGMIYYFNEYKWINRQLTLIYSEKQDYLEDLEIYQRITRTLQNGEWDHKAELIGEDGEPHIIPQH